jgi:hypothetical protein
MKKPIKIFVGSLVGIALIVSGVAMKAQSPPLRPVAQTASNSGAYQRFMPMPRQPENLNGVPWPGAFALDTKTGQLCRTYDGGNDEKWTGLSLCVDLYKKF